MNLEPTVATALEQHKAVIERLPPWRYVRFADTFQGVPRGTAVFEGEVVWGYPEIARIMRLETGLHEHMRAPFWAEEKVDGYNVRIFRHGTAVLALTRRGYLCPFTIDRLPDLLDTRVFDAQPDLVICAEVAGPENPYNEGYPPYVDADVRLFVFDLMRKNSARFLPHAERQQMIQDHGLTGVEQYGRYDVQDLDRLKALVRTLDETGKEGVVLKEDSERDFRVKYVPARTNLRDIQLSARGFLQVRAEYFMQRVLRLALALDEVGTRDVETVEAELGAALLDGIRHGMRQYQEHHRVFQTFRCWFRRRRNAQRFLALQRRLLGRAHVRPRRLRKVGDRYVLEFDKILPKETGLLAHLLRGGLTFD